MKVSLYEIFVGKFSCWKFFVGSTAYENILTRKFLQRNQLSRNTWDIRRSKLEHGEERTERVTSMEELFERNCCIWGYHVYKEVWWMAIGLRWRVVGVRNRSWKCFRCSCEKATIIGHLARKVLQVCSLFLRRGGTYSNWKLGAGNIQLTWH